MKLPLLLAKSAKGQFNKCAGGFRCAGRKGFREFLQDLGYGRQEIAFLRNVGIRLTKKRSYPDPPRGYFPREINWKRQENK
jgi:hypothetical protein